MRRRRLAILATAMLLSPLAAGGAQAQSRLDFSLANSTGYEINEVYVSPTSADAWGSDVLGQDTLPAGRATGIRFNPAASTCRWDMKVVYADGDTSEWRNLDLCRISRITLFWNRQAGTTRAVTE
ncbi:hypothetical protein M0638_21535 [Roseomonas sp. NAR14]|uniref:Argininosuccinate lyase n=1 Tax=Roseomonas acroporae TaxID=2937791 RepID=A0A9X2BYI0_9PROT|nr:hypothetical protein [Roseomonas acroporae]MCK8786959.1 hypothetical protein [Roseomonas acroporae]